MNDNVRPDSDNLSIDITGDFYTTVDGFGYEDYACAVKLKNAEVL